MPTKPKTPSFKIKRRLVVPLLNRGMKENEELVVKSTGLIYTGQPQKGAKASDKPADLMPAVNAMTGEEGEIIVSAVVKSNLEEKYPDGDYVGRYFMITKQEKAKGRRYFNYTVDEVEPA